MRIFLSFVFGGLQAIRRANGVKYGLCAAVWSENVSRIHRVAPQLEVSVYMYVNL